MTDNERPRLTRAEQIQRAASRARLLSPTEKERAADRALTDLRIRPTVTQAPDVEDAR